MIVFIVLLVVSLFVLWRVVGVLRFCFREYYVLWAIVTGARQEKRKMDTKMRVYAFLCQTELLDEASVMEQYKFLTTMMDTEVTVQEFHKLLLSYTYVVLYRERNDGSLRGLMTVGIDRKRQDNGKPYTVLRLGLGFFQINYRGGPYIYLVAVYLFIKELVTHPFTPLYVVGKVFSFKSYCLFSHSLRHCYPRYNLETPEFMKEIINEYGLKVKLPNEIYNTDTFVLARENTILKKNLKDVSKEATEDPDIKFFLERNPGWERGHQLITVALVQWPDVLRIIWKILARAMQRRKVGHRQKPVFLRRNTFQNESANKYSIHFREIDVSGRYHPGDLEDLDMW